MYIDDNCIACGLCIESCPVDAILLTEDKAAINKELCIECGACKDICPMEAIHEEE